MFDVARKYSIIYRGVCATTELQTKVHEDFTITEKAFFWLNARNTSAFTYMTLLIYY